ncbi:uncharacterized protein LOC132192837 isoform X2 [Neocloeon triangulifer]|uniref:uncharacterized protein LOC132192837 isoform X2 n=1 Tax=Neocloeon triangulifer TaxID=2078957 RepID=UPI00286F9537|nr:uncharacterized protein LOC132192837 isoform X2 [Neocloeon triangulifer]
MSSAKLLFFSLACCLAVAASQTFQYSRGWTNGGKRATVPVALQQRRAAEVAVKRAVAVLEDAGLILVPASCDMDVLRPRFRIARRSRPLRQQQTEEEEEARVPDSLAAPASPVQQQAASAGAASTADRGGDGTAAFSF